jgi:hypothetical protein
MGSGAWLFGRTSLSILTPSRPVLARARRFVCGAGLMKRHLLLVALIPGLLMAQSITHRTWKDTAGRAIEAEFVCADALNVTLRVRGQEHRLPLTRLSAEDQAWIRGQTQASPPKVEPTVTKAASGWVIAGVPLRLGMVTEFEVPLSESLLAKLRKTTGSSKESYTDIDMTKAAVGLFLPSTFDPSKPWPIMIISVTDSGRSKGKFPSSVKAMRSYVEAAETLGWVVMAADCPGNLTPGLPLNRCALAEGGLDAIAAVWPASKDWPVATGGFSGGAKYSGWLGGWLSDSGRRVLGMFMGGCNEDMATMAIERLHVPKKAFTTAKVFLSTGSKDQIGDLERTQQVAKSLRRSGFDEVMVGVYQGGHELHREHVLTAMKWFTNQAVP